MKSNFKKNKKIIMFNTIGFAAFLIKLDYILVKLFHL